MAGITFTEGSGLQDSIYGKSQAPIRKFIETKGEAYEQKSILPELFSINPSKQWAEKTTGMTSMEGFKPVGENGEYPVDGMQEGFSKTFVHEVWKDSFSISREMIDDAKLMDLKKKPQAFIKGYYRTREKFGAALYGGAMSQAAEIDFKGKKFSGKCIDGLPLFSKDHPSYTGKYGKQSNCFSDAFSNDALMYAEAAMQNFRDDNGEVLAIVPTTIVIPNDAGLKKDVFASIGADKDPATANNGFNYTYGRWTVVVWQYLNQFIKAGKKPWMLLDKEAMEELDGALWFDRVMLEVKSQIAHNDANEWTGYARYNAGFGNWHFACVGGVEGGTKLISA